MKTRSKKDEPKIKGAVIPAGTEFEVGDNKHATYSNLNVVINGKDTKKIEVSLQRFAEIHKKGSDNEAAAGKLLCFLFKVYTGEKKALESAKNLLRKDDFAELCVMITKIFTAPE
ncbi:hypothetical protein ACFL0K_00520 [Patescibacteria group bacterium]